MASWKKEEEVPKESEYFKPLFDMFPEIKVTRVSRYDEGYFGNGHCVFFYLNGKYIKSGYLHQAIGHFSRTNYRDPEQVESWKNYIQKIISE